MDLILTDAAGPRALTFYLALEEWLATQKAGRDFFFIWQVEPTVIIGRHQLLESEVHLDFCRANGINICRRKSGGGAVLADMNNVMFSYITSSDDVTTTFSTYTSMVAASLRALGLQASDNSRNDILIGDRKVSGNSFFHLPGRSIVHGTMLYDYDQRMMAGALTPPTSKLQSHGVNSVRSRITTIREHLPHLSLSDFKAHALRTIPDGDTYSLTPGDIREIEALEQPYLSEQWLRGRSPRGTLSHTMRIDGVGTITVHLGLKGGIVESFDLSGDYLETSPASQAIAQALEGKPYEKEALDMALKPIDLPRLIPGLTREALLNMIF